MAGRDTDDIDDKLGGRGSETGSGNDAHWAPGESGQAEGADYARRLFPQNGQRDPDHPRSSSEGTATGASRRRGPEDEIERLTPVIPDIPGKPRA